MLQGSIVDPMASVRDGNSLCAKMFGWEYGYVLAFHIISWNWDGKGTLNHSSWKMTTSLSYAANTMVADDMTMQGARASTGMVLSWTAEMAGLVKGAARLYGVSHD